MANGLITCIVLTPELGQSSPSPTGEGGEGDPAHNAAIGLNIAQFLALYKLQIEFERYGFLFPGPMATVSSCRGGGSYARGTPVISIRVFPGALPCAPSTIPASPGDWWERQE